MSSTDLVWVEPSEPSRAERMAALREARRRRRQNFALGALGIVGAVVVFVAVLTIATRHNSGTPEAGASETIPATTSSSIAAEWGPTTTVPTPETVPAPVAPSWVQVPVAVGDFNGLAKLVTDGQPGHCDRVLPGQLGRAVIALPLTAAAAASAATVIVNNEPWRVFSRPTPDKPAIAANDLGSLCDARPIVPTVLLVSSTPGDARPFLEASK